MHQLGLWQFFQLNIYEGEKQCLRQIIIISRIWEATSLAARTVFQGKLLNN